MRESKIRPPSLRRAEPVTEGFPSEVFAKRVRSLMRDENLGSQQALADELGVKSKSVIGGWLDKTRPPGGRDLWRLSRRFNVTVDWLLGVKGAPRSSKDYASPDDATFREFLADEIRRGATGERGKLIRGCVLDIENVLADARALVVKELEEWLSHFDWASNLPRRVLRDMNANLEDLYRTPGLRRGDRTRLHQVATAISARARETVLEGLRARPVIFSASGTATPRYIAPTEEYLRSRAPAAPRLTTGAQEPPSKGRGRR